MAEPIESGIGTLNYGKQSAKGTAATASSTAVGTNRPKWVGGQFGARKALGQEEYIDGQRFASPSMFTDRVGGEVGEVTIQAQPENAGLFFAQILGVDTVTGIADPWTHTITSAGSTGPWGTWWQKTGSAIGPNREMYSDSKVARLVSRHGVDQKVLHQELAIQALNPAEIYTTDAAKTEDTADPFLHTEMTGGLTFDSTVISEVEEQVLEIDTQMAPYWGDSIVPLHLIEGKGSIVRTVNSIVTNDTLLKYKKAVYNATAPTAGTKPVKDVFYASVTSVHTRSATRTLTIATPRVAIRPDDMTIGALAEGGKAEISFGGPCLKSGATAAVTVTALTADATSYV